MKQKGSFQIHIDYSQGTVYFISFLRNLRAVTKALQVR
jgi:hypothetical protein